ncbi:MAG: hypothetical protein AAF705_21935, partial [Bacteroidota bacterium]
MKKIVLGLWFVLLALVLNAQDVTIKRDSEVMDSTKFSGLVKRYEQIIMADREELALLKIDLLGPLLYAMSAEDSAKS